MHSLLLIPALLTLAAPPTWYDKAVKKVEATFEPAEAKPGQTVTLKLTVQLNDGYMTYPTAQKDKAAAGMVNVLKFPDAGALVFVGHVIEPPHPKTKAEPELGIREYSTYSGKVVYERKAVVAPAQKPGPVTVRLPKFGLTVCDAKNCFPAKSLTPEATLKVLPGPPVPVEPKYAAEVKKATGGK
jgi:hypothetical protein